MASFLHACPNTGLEILSVAQNNIGVRGIQALVTAALTSPTITVLNLSDNPGVRAMPLDSSSNGRQQFGSVLHQHLQKNRQLASKRRSSDKAHASRKRRRVDRLADRLVQRRNVLHNLHVGILGGGVAGMALALALHGKGIRCTVFERDKRFDERHQGYGLTLQKGGRAMKALDVAEQIAARGTWSSGHFIFNSEGDVLAFWGPKQVRENRVRSSETSSFDRVKQMGRHNIHIARQSLRRVLYDACIERLPSDAIRWGHRVNRVENLVAVVKNGNDSPSSSSLVVGKPTVAADNTNDPTVAFTLILGKIHSSAI